MHNSNMYFCLVSKGNPEYKIIIILFMRFPFSIVLYEFSPYSLCELKYCSYKTAQTQSKWELVFMMVLFLWLYWFFWLSVAQIIVSTPWFCLLCLIQKGLLGGINYPSRKTYHSYNCKGSILGDLTGLEVRFLSFYVILTTGSFCWLVSC